MSRRKVRKFRNRSRRNGRSRNEANKLITVINNQPRQTRVIRYKLATDASITRGDLLSALVAVTAASTTSVTLFESVRLDGLRLVVLPNNNGNLATCSLTWSGERSPDITETLVCTNAIPSHAMFRPPKNSLAGYWSEQSGDTTEKLFDLTVDADCEMLVDIHMTYVIGNGATSTVTLTGVPGITGIAALQLPVGGTALRPVDIQNDIAS